MNELALFAGAGGGILGGKLLGWRCVCAVEYDEHARAVLAARQNDCCLAPFPIWDDVRTFDGRPWRGRVDVVSGGFPCQAYSGAARGRNNAPDLWPEMRRIVADVAPPFVFAENVTRRAIERAARDLTEMGYACRAVRVSAADLGADHNRPRYWLRAYSDRNGELRNALDAEMEMLPELRGGIWETFDRESYMVDGVASEVDGLRLTGNGQVPIVAAAAWLSCGGRPDAC